MQINFCGRYNHNVEEAMELSTTIMLHKITSLHNTASPANVIDNTGHFFGITTICKVERLLSNTYLVELLSSRQSILLILKKIHWHYKARLALFTRGWFDNGTISPNFSHADREQQNLRYFKNLASWAAKWEMVYHRLPTEPLQCTKLVLCSSYFQLL